jgi:hypothetical protein
VKRILGLSLLLAIAANFASAQQNVQVTVTDTNGNPVAGAGVVALFFNNGQPDPVASKGAIAGANGIAFLNVNPGVTYQVVAASQSYAPGYIDQLTNGPVSIVAGVAATQPPYTQVAITLTPGAAGVGEIDVPFNGATANGLLFGQVGLQAGGGASAYGVALISGSGSGVIQFLNVTAAPGGTYQVSANDSRANNGTGANASQPVAATLSAGGLISLVTPFSFAAAPPPPANISQTQASGSEGNVSLSGVVVDTAGVPIPFVGLNFQSQTSPDQYGHTFSDWRGAQTDQNGSFQLYSLNTGSTYYASIFGNCNFNNGICYQGSNSTSAPTGASPCTTVNVVGGVVSGGLCPAPGINDFLYKSTATVQTLRIALNQQPKSSGVMAVYVQDQFGNPFIQANVNISPDGQPWPTAGGSLCGAAISNPGLVNVNLNATTGYALVTGLASGNYQVNSFTPYGQASFNAGADGKQGFNGCGNIGNAASGNGLDDRRVTIDTTQVVNRDVGVYDIYGNVVSSGIPSVTITVQLSTGASGVVQGTLTFPNTVNDLSKSPISIVLNPNCSGNNGGFCGGGGFASFSSSLMPQTTTYSIPVSSGQSYYLNILSNYWGAVYPGGNQPNPDLSKSTSTVMNIQFQAGGRVLGYMRKPDGSVYVPPSGNQGGTPNVNANGNSSYGNAQINSDGSYVIGGLLPGSYSLQANAGGVTTFPYTTKVPQPQITIVAGQDVNQDVNLVDAVTLQPLVDITQLPALNILTCANNRGNNSGQCPPETFEAWAQPTGTPFNTTNVTNLLANSGGSNGNVFSYSLSTGSSSNCNGGATLSQAGFCPNPTPATKTGSAFDFYTLRYGGFDSSNLAGGVRPYFVVESSTKNIIVGPSYAKSQFYDPNLNSSSTIETVTLTPASSLASVQQAVLAGTVTAVNMINQREFSQLGGNFNGFLAYLPLVWAYDSSGTLKAVGLVVPFPPSENNKDTALKQSVSAGNFTQFQSLLGPVPTGWGAIGYEIRGLTANTTYNLLVTTPNYPPFKTVAVTGAAGSTTSVNVNLDANPGATISGLVQTSGGAAIPGAQITVSASGYAPTTITTDLNGNWSLSGLGAGQYQVLAVAPGYAQSQQSVQVTGAAVSVPTFALALANATISGTVYTNNPVCPPGVACSAFGKTALAGITVLAYDDTLNVNSPLTSLPLYRAVTSSSGTYQITGLVTNDSLGLHTYKLFVNAPGYFVLNQTTVAVVGAVKGFDFALKPKPLTVNVFGHVVGTNYEFQITNYQSFSTGKAFISAAPYAGDLAAGTTNISNLFVQRPDASGTQQLFLDYPIVNLTAGQSYVLHIEGQPNDPRAPIVVKELTFGISLTNGACQNIDQALIGDNSGVNAQGLPNNLAPIDLSGGTNGNNSGLTLPAGGVIPTLSTAVPTMCMNATDPSASPQGTLGARTSATQALTRFASGVYNVTLSSVNYTPRGVNLTLTYNQNGSNLNDLAIFTFDVPSQSWKIVPGVQTIDPVKGTISIQGLKSLSSVLSYEGADGVASVNSSGSGSRMMALTDGKSFRPNSQTLIADDSGEFAIMRPSQVSGGAFTGTIVKVYNFPNPFNLQTKNVQLNTSVACLGAGTGSITTNGTVIKYEIPGGISGTGVIRIYTLSGRLVREVDAGNISANTCYYTTWDGRNREGLPVANGVYYGILSVGGSKQSSGTFKLAVIK